MKRLVSADTVIQFDNPVDSYCETVGELIDALQKLPRDASFYTGTGKKSYTRTAVRVHEEDINDRYGDTHRRVFVETID